MIRIETLDVGHASNKSLFKAKGIEFTPGERIALVGKNGSGKSTFLKTLCGILPALKGSVYYNSQPIHTYSPFERAGMVSYFKALAPPGFELTVMDLIYMYPYSKPKTTWLQAKHDMVLDAFKLLPMLNTPLSKLSDGWNQKALIARTCLQESRFIVLDEPTLYLDVFARRDFHKLMHNLTQEFKIGVLYSTHDLELLSQNADRIFTIQDGTLRSFTNSAWAEFGSEAFLNSR